MIDKVLGQKVTYPHAYSPDILVAVPRQLNRESLKIDAGALPFSGCDVWHAYEASFLMSNGLPVVGILKLVYSSVSRCIVESKSLKLYLNSLNMTQLGNLRADAIARYVEIVSRDLSHLLQSKVEATFFACDAPLRPLPVAPFALLEDAYQPNISKYTESPELLRVGQSGVQAVDVCSHLLRSNCRVTHQPDWGTIYISMAGDLLPDLSGLLAYIVSLRGENHFHEEICEMVFVRLLRLFAPRRLMVACLYTRRGGIDICPVRVLGDVSSYSLPAELAQSDVLHSLSARN